MLKFPFVEWSWLGQYRRGVDVAMRGECDSRVTWVPYYEPGKYDAAILHLDQDCVIPYELRARKGVVYRQMNEVIRDIPKIVIMHGAPYSPEALDRDDIIERVKAQVGDNYMVVNSHRAAEEWGWGKVIIHGMSANEWFDLPKEPRVVTVLSPRGMPAYYDRPFLADVRTALAGRDIMHCHIGVEWKARSWEEYRRFLGSSLLYFNPTFESPMPRARTEAMLSGCCVLTTPHHDADTFIEHGVNGHLVSRNPAEVASLVEYLLSHPGEAIAIGRKGRETALQLFDWQRYANEWEAYLQFVLDDFRSRGKSMIAAGGCERLDRTPLKHGVGILTYEQKWAAENVASSRIRGQWLVDCWKDAELFTIGRRYDAVIFQKVYWPEYARLFDGVKILDICDPDFLDWKWTVWEMASCCDAITTCTDRLKEFIGNYTDKPIHVIPDRMDLSTVEGLRKIHHGPTKTAAWCGNAHNYVALNSFVGELKRLGIERLIVISQKEKPFALPRELAGAFEVKNYPWSVSTVNERLLEADVVLNPGMTYGRWQYKSNNKTVNAWALGLPVAHTVAELAGLLTQQARQDEGDRRYAEVREHYDVRLSVAEFERLIGELQGIRRPQ